jgi:uncharacterized membrane protein
MTIALLAGLTFRILHVDRLVFWGDEAFTALRISGHAFADFTGLFDGRIHELSEIHKLQSVDDAKGVAGTIHGLAVEEPQHPPLFYVLERGWAKVFGSSIRALRSLPVIFAVLTLPLCYWLALELFGSTIVAATATTLMALSPLFILYSSQAREYSLWATLVCLSSILLLRALRDNSVLTWAFYACTMAASLYCFPLSVLVLIAHAVVVVTTQRTRVVGFISTASIALATFVPWLFLVNQARSMVSEQMAFSGGVGFPLRQYLSKLAFNVGAVFWDLEYVNLKLAVVAVLFILLTIAAFVYVVREERRARAFLVAIIVIPFAPLLLYDLYAHSHYALAERYSMPVWIGLILIVAGYLGRQIEAGRMVGLLAFLLVVAAETTSAAASVSAVVWWHNNDNFPVLGITAAVAKSRPQPVVVSETNYELLVLSHYLRADTRLLLFDHHVPFPVSSAAFLVAPSKETLAQFEHQPSYRLDGVYVPALTSPVVQEFHKSLVRASHGKDLAEGFAYRETFLFKVRRIDAPEAKTRTSQR